MEYPYKDRDTMQLDEEGNYFSNHMFCMTEHRLHDKSAIAAELGYRDMLVKQLTEDLATAISALDDIWAGNDKLREERDEAVKQWHAWMDAERIKSKENFTLLEENAKMQKAIDEFCDEEAEIQHTCHEGPHIKALFDLRSER